MSENKMGQEFTRIGLFLTIQMILLVIQFITGIVENKYPLTSVFELSGIVNLTVELLIHVADGFAIVIIGILMLYLSIRTHERSLIILNLIAPVLAGLAIHAGATYFLYGFDSAWSVWMAICYITAFLIYCIQAQKMVLIKKSAGSE